MLYESGSNLGWIWINLVGSGLARAGSPKLTYSRRNGGSEVPRVPSERKFRGTEGSIGTKVQWVPVPFVSMVLVPRVPFVSMVPVPRVPFVSKVPLFSCSVGFIMF